MECSTCFKYNIRMNVVKRLLWTLSYRIILLVITFLALLILMITTPIFFPWRDRITDFVAFWWAAIILKSAGIEVITDGVEYVPEAPPYLIVFNHQSEFDIYALMVGLPRLYRAIMKKELMYYPLIGWVIVFLGFVPIDRKNRSNAIRALNRAAKMFNRFPYMMAITGTRVRNRDFMTCRLKKGPVVTGIQYNVPILPVTIVGADEIHVKGLGLIHPCKTIRLFVHPIMDTTGWTMAERNERVEQLRHILGKPISKEAL